MVNRPSQQSSFHAKKICAVAGLGLLIVIILIILYCLIQLEKEVNQAKQDERIIRFLLSLKQEATVNGIEVVVTRQAFNDSKLARSRFSPICEDEFIRRLITLDARSFVKAVFKTQERNLAYSVRVVLLPAIHDYSYNKKRDRIANRNYWIQFIVPVVASIAALVVSILKP